MDSPFAGVLLTMDIFSNTSATFSRSWIGYLAIIGAVIGSTVYRVRMELLTKDFAPALISTWIFWINALVAVLFIWPFQEPFPKL